MPAHRTFVLSSPLMHGSDIKDFQHVLRGQFEEWHVNYTVSADGVYGVHTRAACSTVMHGLGIAQSALERHGCTPYIRNLILHPDRRNAIQKQRAHDRHHWLVRLQAAHKLGVGEAIAKYALSQVGVDEQPPGSNLGPKITEWERLAGYSVPPGVYWCGCFANACLVAAGFPSQTWGIGYCPSIESRARAGIDGWTWHGPTADPKKGWLALFTEGGVAGHVEVVVENGWPLNTVGGNTSKGDGSPNNGGCVAHHNFAHYRGLPLRGFAAPRGTA